MRLPRMTTRRWMKVVAGVAFAVALWQAGLGANRWQSVCSVTFFPDGRTVAAGLYSGKVLCGNGELETKFLTELELGIEYDVPGTQVVPLADVENVLGHADPGQGLTFMGTGNSSAASTETRRT